MTPSKPKKALARLTEAEAWERLAEWVAARPKNGQKRTYLCHRLRNAYIGAAGANIPRGFRNPGLEELPRKFAPLGTLQHMQARLRRHFNAGVSMTLDEPPRDWDEWAQETPGAFLRRLSKNNPRVIFCLLMALECREEAK